MGHDRPDVSRTQAAPRLVRRGEPRGDRLADQVGGRARHLELLRRLVLEQGFAPARALGEGLPEGEVPQVPEVVHDVRQPQPARRALDRGPDRGDEVLDRQLLQNARVLPDRRQAGRLHLAGLADRLRFHRRGRGEGREAREGRGASPRVRDQRAARPRGGAARHPLAGHVADARLRREVRRGAPGAGLRDGDRLQLRHVRACARARRDEARRDDEALLVRRRHQCDRRILARDVDAGDASVLADPADGMGRPSALVLALPRHHGPHGGEVRRGL